MADYQIAKELSGLDTLAAYRHATAQILGGPEPEQIQGAEVSDQFFEIFHERPALGRSFFPEEFLAGREAVVILGHSFSKRQFNSSDRVIGKSLLLNLKSYTVVGVASPGFSFPDDVAEFWVPLVLSRDGIEEREATDINLVGRLADGSTLEDVQQSLDLVKRRQTIENPAVRGDRLVAIFLREVYVGEIRTTLLVIAASGGLLFLVSCINLGNLTLVRAFDRQSEFSIRMALGARQVQIFKLVLVENVFLTCIGSLAGVFVAYWGIYLFRILAPSGFPRIEEIAVDIKVLLLAAVVSFIPTLVFALMPAASAAKLSPTSLSQLSLIRSMRGGHHQARRREFFVATQIAVVFVLLVASGLLLRSFARLMSTDLGFEHRNLYTFWVSLPEQKYRTSIQRSLFFTEVLTRIGGIGGVRSVGISFNSFFSGSTMTHFRSQDGAHDTSGEVEFRVVSSGFLQTLGIPLIDGRYFTDDSKVGDEYVVVVNDAARRSGILGPDPLHKEILILGQWRRIVGVVGDVRDIFTRAKTRPTVYVPYFSFPTSNGMLAVRTEIPIPGFERIIRSQVYAVDPDQPVAAMSTLNRRIDAIVSAPRFNAFILSLFAVLGLVFSVSGVYGVAAYSISQRRREIGIRVALGAHPADILRLLAVGGLRMALMGTSVGIVVAVGLTGVLSGLLFEISPTDSVTFVSCLVLTLTSAAVAYLLPVLHTLRAEPMAILRYE